MPTIFRTGGGGGESGCKVVFDNYAPPGGVDNLGQLEPLSQARNQLAATTVGEMAIFAGGYGTATSAIVDAYSKTGARTTLASLSQARGQLAATTVGEMAIFAGGYGTATSAIVDAYSKTGTRTILTNISQARVRLVATAVGEMAIIAGGWLSNGSDTVTAIVDAYSKTGVRTTLASLSRARYDHAATAVGEMAIFAGGIEPQFSGGEIVGGLRCAKVDAYSQTGAKTTLTDLSQARNLLVATTVGEMAIFAGGSGSTRADAYSQTGARTTLEDLPQVSIYNAAATAGNMAIFAGGSPDGNARNAIAVANAYSKTGARTTLASLSQARSHFAATTVGEMAIFAGGYNSTALAVADVYGEKTTAEIPILGGGKYDFGSGETIAPGSAVTVNLIKAQIPVNGYIEYKGAVISG